MDLSNRYKSKYYKDNSWINSVLITIGIMILLLLFIYWAFMRGSDSLISFFNHREVTSVVGEQYCNHNIRYKSITPIKKVGTAYEGDGDVWSIKVTGYQAEGMSSPVDTTLLDTIIVKTTR